MRKLILAVVASLALAILPKAANAQVVIYPTNLFNNVSFTNGLTLTSGQLLLPDGTAPLPSIAYISEPTLGLYRNSAGNGTWLGVWNVTGNIAGAANIFAGAGNAIIWQNRTVLNSPIDGKLAATNQAQTIGVQLKFDSLPTVASGFGTSPSITAGSTAFAGSVNVGTGASSSGIINFNGTAFPSAPFCVASDDSSILAVKPLASTTQLTLSAVAFTASDIISWICVSSK